MWLNVVWVWLLSTTQLKTLRITYLRFGAFWITYWFKRTFYSSKLPDSGSLPSLDASWCVTLRWGQVPQLFLQANNMIPKDFKPQRVRSKFNTPSTLRPRGWRPLRSSKEPVSPKASNIERLQPVFQRFSWKFLLDKIMLVNFLARIVPRPFSKNSEKNPYITKLSILGFFIILVENALNYFAWKNHGGRYFSQSFRQPYGDVACRECQ